MNIFSKWKNKITQYIDIRMRMMKLSIVERVSTILSYFVLVFVMLFLGLSILIFLGIGLGEYIATQTDNRYTAYFIVAGIYLLLIILFILLKKVVSRIFQGVFIAMLTQKSEADDDDEDDDINREINVS